MADTHEVRLARAGDSLLGLSVGDSFGEQFFRHAVHDLFPERTLPPPIWPFTDDTNMALSVYAVLRRHGEIDQDRLAQSFAEHYDPLRGYGLAMHGHLQNILEGYSWRASAGALFRGTGSYGNGAAMRIAPLGAYFADDVEQVIEQARLSAEVTHIHPEGIAGAVAAAVAFRRRGSEPAPTCRQFLDHILPHVPESDVRAGIAKARELAPDAPVTLAMYTLGNGSRISAQDTLPFALWCAGGSLDDFTGALWTTVCGGGDVDTTCAIVGGIVAAYTGAEGIPQEWINRREPLPEWAFDEFA